jgi:hypothetical protein
MSLFYKLAIALLLGVSLSGCESLSLIAPYENTTTRNVERTWLVMHAIDTAQTVTIARSPECLIEANPIAAKIYGSNSPSAERVLATNLLLGYLHYRIGGWIDKKTEEAILDPKSESVGAWYTTRLAWHGLAIVGTGAAVANNYSRGVQPFSHVTGCKR